MCCGVGIIPHQRGNRDSAPSHHATADYFPITAQHPNVFFLTHNLIAACFSPVSRDELMQEYSPLSESSENLMKNPQALDLLHLTGQAAYPKAGDCNKNLIQSFSSAAADSPLIRSLEPSMDKLGV